MSTCATCRHWGQEKEDNLADLAEGDDEATPGQKAHVALAKTNPLRRCLAVPFYYDSAGLCAVACVTDGSGYRGAFWTRSEFGCALHSAPTSPAPA